MDRQRRVLFCNHSNGDLFTREDIVFLRESSPGYFICVYIMNTFFKYLLNGKTPNITSGAVNSSSFDDSRPYSYVKYKPHTVSPPSSPKQLFANMGVAHQQK